MVHAQAPAPKENCVAKARTSARCSPLVKKEAANDLPMEWPGAGVLFMCAGLLMAGLAAAAWRGPAPAGDVAVIVAPAAEPPEPADP